MSGDIDSRPSDTTDGASDSPGANDNASGMAGTIEVARILSEHRFPTSVVFVGLSGEEQGLWGGQHMAQVAREEGWTIDAVLNNDMIGNIEGIDGVIDNSTFRVFSEPTPLPEYQSDSWSYRTNGGEVDGPSRQIARFVDRIADLYFPNLDAMMIYRLDRFGRGGHHRPFNDAGFPAVRIMETHEQVRAAAPGRSHRERDRVRGCDRGRRLPLRRDDEFAECDCPRRARLGASRPENVRIGGAVGPSTTLAWDLVDDPGLAGYKVYWRWTTDSQWRWSRWVGDATTFTLTDLVIDNYLFGGRGGRAGRKRERRLLSHLDPPQVNPRREPPLS